MKSKVLVVIDIQSEITKIQENYREHQPSR